MGHLWGMPCSLRNARFLWAPFLGPAMPSPLPGLSACLYLPAQVVTSGHSELAERNLWCLRFSCVRVTGCKRRYHSGHPRFISATETWPCDLCNGSVKHELQRMAWLNRLPKLISRAVISPTIISGGYCNTMKASRL